MGLGLKAQSVWVGAVPSLSPGPGPTGELFEPAELSPGAPAACYLTALHL